MRVGDAISSLINELLTKKNNRGQEKEGQIGDATGSAGKKYQH